MRNELRNGIILSITVILIILVVYLTTAVFMTGEIGSKKSSEKKTTTTNAASSYENKILASKVFDQTPETYKVLIFSEQDVSDDLKSAITSYSGNTKLYLVNKDEAINKYVSSDTDNVKPDNSSSLKVKKEALLTISNESVTSYVTNESEIIDELK
jgi:hypothetical protein